MVPNFFECNFALIFENNDTFTKENIILSKALVILKIPENLRHSYHYMYVFNTLQIITFKIDILRVIKILVINRSMSVIKVIVR